MTEIIGGGSAAESAEADQGAAVPAKARKRSALRS